MVDRYQHYRVQYGGQVPALQIWLEGQVPALRSVALGTGTNIAECSLRDWYQRYTVQYGGQVPTL